MLFATGRLQSAGRSRCRIPTTGVCKAFAQALERLLKDLALQVVRDGEGARKMVESR